jgi:hypothetical protein
MFRSLLPDILSRFSIRPTVSKPLVVSTDWAATCTIDSAMRITKVFDYMCIAVFTLTASILFPLPSPPNCGLAGGPPANAAHAIGATVLEAKG